MSSHALRTRARTVAFWILAAIAYAMVAAVAAGWLLVIVPIGGQ